MDSEYYFKWPKVADAVIEAKETTLKYIHLAKTNLRQEMVETAL